jgi:hypothetical protein
VGKVRINAVLYDMPSSPLSLNRMAESDSADALLGQDAGVNDDAHDNTTGPPGVFVWLLTLSAGISGLLFGCKALMVAVQC